MLHNKKYRINGTDFLPLGVFKVVGEEDKEKPPNMTQKGAVIGRSVMKQPRGSTWSIKKGLSWYRMLNRALRD